MKAGTLALADPAALGATEAAARIGRGELSSEALVSACLDRIASREPLIEAWAHLDPVFALEQARRADEVRSRGGPMAPLHGVPAGVKDIIDTADFPTEHGSPVFAGRRPTADAAVVTILKKAGAIILGKTATAELAFFSPARTRNPANPEHTPGGSSSGSAAAVADSHVPITLGTQTRGSILRPASFCGVVGMKPTFGLVPRDGVLEQSAPLDTIGGLARSVADMALLLAVLGVPVEGPADAAGHEPRLAFVRAPEWPEAEPRTHAAILAFVAKLGARIEEVPLPPIFDGGPDAQRTIQSFDIARNYGPLLDRHPDLISAQLAEVIGLGRAMTAEAYEAALALREPLYAELAAILSRHDAVLTLASAGSAPRGLASTGSPIFNGLWTFLGVPAISLPLLQVEEMPLGVQIIGARNADSHLLATARRLETCSGL